MRRAGQNPTDVEVDRRFYLVSIIFSFAAIVQKNLMFEKIDRATLNLN